MSAGFDYWYRSYPVVHLTNTGGFQAWYRNFPEVQLRGASVAATAQVPYEALSHALPVDRQLVVSYEALANVHSAPRAPYEALRRIDQWLEAVYEVLVYALRDLEIPYEDLVRLLEEGETPHEAAGSLSSTLTLPYEALSQTGYGGVVYEALGAVSAKLLHIDMHVGAVLAVLRSIESPGWLATQLRSIERVLVAVQRTLHELVNFRPYQQLGQRMRIQRIDHEEKLEKH